MFSKLELHKGDAPLKDTAVSNSSRDSRLTDHYPSAYKDFNGMPSCAPCIFKSGPSWPEREEPEAQRFIREARPVHGHLIADCWIQLGTQMYQLLDAYGVIWTSIDPVGFANAGEKTPICPLLIWIGVKRDTLSFNDAVAAAAAIKQILAQSGFPDIEVAFRESEVTRSVSGPKLLSITPLVDPIPEFRKPFTPTLGLAIAPHQTPDHEGTGALYFRLSKDDERVALLTTSHVARPPHPNAHTGMFREHASQPHEDIIALGTKGYQNATNTMKATVDNLTYSVKEWNKVIARLGDFVEREDAAVTAKRKESQFKVERATKKIGRLNTFCDEVAERMKDLDNRTIGFVLHAEPIVVANGPCEFTRDWAFIELYREKIAWDTFPGNKVYVGGNLSSFDFDRLMFPQPEDQAGHEYPEDGLLQVCGVVKHEEIRQPRHLDALGHKALLVVKNGLATGTTIGRVNGLESFTRVYGDYGIEQTSIEVAILSYDNHHCPFSARGDSGAIILDRAGRIVAMLTGGTGMTDETDITYGTPYWWLEQQIKMVYPGCHLY